MRRSTYRPLDGADAPAAERPWPRGLPQRLRWRAQRALLAVAALAGAVLPAHAFTRTFTDVTAPINWVVPAGVTKIDIVATGAGGGSGGAPTPFISFPGGGGAIVTTRNLAVAPGDAFFLELGRGGGGASAAMNGGGGGGSTSITPGDGSVGVPVITIGPDGSLIVTPGPSVNPIIIAGAGGGGSWGTAFAFGGVGCGDPATGKGGSGAGGLSAGVGGGSGIGGMGGAGSAAQAGKNGTGGTGGMGGDTGGGAGGLVAGGGGGGGRASGGPGADSSGGGGGGFGGGGGGKLASGAFFGGGGAGGSLWPGLNGTPALGATGTCSTANNGGAVRLVNGLLDLSGGNGSVSISYTGGTVGGSISGLNAPGLQLVLGTSPEQTFSPAANATSFVFPDGVGTGTTYRVAVMRPPPGLQCSVVNGSGTMGSANVNNVRITCAPGEPTAPFARADAAVALSSASARLAGVVSANGAPTEVFFEVDVSTAFNVFPIDLPIPLPGGGLVTTTILPTGQRIAGVPSLVPASVSGASVSAVVSGLKPCQTYYFRVVASNQPPGTFFPVVANSNNVAFDAGACPKQTLNFPAQTPSSQTFARGGTFAINPLATSTSPNSGNPITYSSLTTSVCTVSDTTVTMVGLGVCTLAADQAGNANYSAANQVTQDVTLNQPGQTLTFPAQTPASQTFVAGGTFAINPLATSASPNSGAPISYSSLTPLVCTVSITTVTMVATGICTLAADQGAGKGGYYSAASQVTQTVAIIPPRQILSFPAQAPASQTFAAGGTFAINPLATSANPNSGNPISYSSLTTPVCTVSGTTVTMVAFGVCTLAADQAGNANYSAANQVTQAVTINVDKTFSGATMPPDGRGEPASASFTGGGPGCTFDKANTGFIASSTAAPPSKALPQGVFKFRLTGCDEASTVTMSVTWPQALTQYAKYGKASLGATSDSWFAPPALVISGHTATFSITDGGIGDSDAAAGVIADPTAPLADASVLATPVPALSWWGLWLLPGLLAGAALLRRRTG